MCQYSLRQRNFALNCSQVCQYRLSLVGSLCNPTVRSSMSRNRFKWLRGALARDRAIYGIPSNADCVLRIVPPTRPGEYAISPLLVEVLLVSLVLGLCVGDSASQRQSFGIAFCTRCRASKSTVGIWVACTYDQFSHQEKVHDKDFLHLP